MLVSELTKSNEVSDEKQGDGGEIACSAACTHRMTIYLEGGANATTDTNEPEVVRQQIVDFIDSYYGFRWLKRRKATLTIGGKPQVVLPIEKIQCFKIEEIGRRSTECQDRSNAH